MLVKKRLLFVSTRFLLPIDSGGKIRTTQTLRGLLGGEFEVTLMSPATAEELSKWRDELPGLCDHFVHWPAVPRGPLFQLLRMRHLFDTLPIPVRTDYSKQAIDAIESIAETFDVVVFDFLHASVLNTGRVKKPTVMFTHNVEAEIFARHYEHAGNPLMRWLWKSQWKKMQHFEERELPRYDQVVAVSDRDKTQFLDAEQSLPVQVIPTGVDLDFFTYKSPEIKELIFIGSMDWLPNQDAIRFFGTDIWPLVVQRHPELKLTVIGRSPPADLIEMARNKGYNWEFTGFVDDIRDHTDGRAISILPIRIGGGTRLKAYESMAMGAVMVSTSVGVEGLPIEPGTHYLQADTPEAFVDAITLLLRDEARLQHMSAAARKCVEDHYGYRVAASVFERICCDAIESRSSE